MLEDDKSNEWEALRLIELENCLSTSIQASNKESVQAFAKQVDLDRVKNKEDFIVHGTGWFEVAMAASPSYAFSKESNRGKALCDIFAYRVSICPETEENQCELIISKLEMETIYKDKTMVIDKLDKQVIQSMKAWTLTSFPSYDRLLAYCNFESMTDIIPSSHAIDIRNLQNAFFHRRLRNCRHLFSDKEGVSIRIEPLGNEEITGRDKILLQMKKWLDEEMSDLGFYKFMGITSASSIKVKDDEGTAQSQCMVEVFSLERSSKDNGSHDSHDVIHSVCSMNAIYCLEGSQWKIVAIEIDTIFELPRESYRLGYRYDHMTGEPNVWYKPTQLHPIHSSHEIYEIENIVHQWGYYCRCGKLLDFYNEYMRNHEIQPKMYFKSQGKISKPCQTEKEITQRLSGMDARFTPLMYSYHTATTPVIQTDETGEAAVGIWYDRSATNLLSQAKSRDCIPYMALLTKYIHYFQKISGKWYLVGFFAEPLISFQDWHLKPQESEGFIGQKCAASLPNPYLT